MSRTGGGVAVLALLLGGCSSDPSGPAPPVCPVDLPTMGSACGLPGVQCGYARSANACAVACDCQGGAWLCGPTCIIVVEDASVSGGDAADGGGVSDADGAPGSSGEP